MRGIALSTCVTLLVPEDRRDRANGMVGTVTGVSFAITSVFSGLVIGQLGMGWALYARARAHGRRPRAPPHASTSTSPSRRRPQRRRRRAASTCAAPLEAIRAVPGLLMLILLAAFNNLLGGVFMALMDAYGLSLVSVETWGFLWGFISLAFIAGGLVVAKFGLGPTPVRVVLLGNLVNWIVCAVFTLRSSIVLLAVGMFVWLLLIPVIEAAEQTVLQRSIPFERQGRVFGFAQLVENAASPLTAFLHGPAGRGGVHAVHDRRPRRRLDRRLVRHRPRARPRPDVHARRAHRRRRDPAGRASRAYRALTLAPAS